MGDMIKDAEKERKLELNRIGVRTYVQRPDITKHHSFIVGCDTFGLSARLSEVVVSETMTLRELRGEMEIMKIDGMCRRPTLFCEILHLMQIAPNPFMYPEKRKFTEFRFAVSPCKHPSAWDLPYVIPKHLEPEIICLKCPVVDAYPTVVCVPVTQVSPITDQVKGWKAKNEGPDGYNFQFPPKVDEVKAAAEAKAKAEEEAEEALREAEDAKAKADKEEERAKRAERRRQKKLLRLQKQLNGGRAARTKLKKR
jgi:hypothetical protein